MRSLATAISLIALLTIVGFGSAAHAQPPLHGLAPTPLPAKPDFTLTTTGGRPFSFAAATHGKLTYLYFGYTHCRDACPTTMSDIAAALRRVPAGVRRHVEVVFVTVDPQRDTKRVLRAWLNRFDHAFIGLTGSEREIRAAEQAAGIAVPPSDKNRSGNYAVQHSSLLIPYSLDNYAHVVYTQGFHTSDYIHDMPLLLLRY
ncbi:MAG: electron transport protein SCO1/SenC [Actinomycetia bacterium]|nr:electron transport protein SCO1/SenC [Actinomycetes bacterium]